MNDETTDLNVALGIAIEQRNAAQNEIIRMAMTIGQLTRKIAALEKAVQTDAMAGVTDLTQKPNESTEPVAVKANGSAEHVPA